MIETKIENNVVVLRLNHENLGNSFGESEAAALKKVLSKKHHGLILTGSGTRFFCAGGNLREQIVQGKKSFQTQVKISHLLKILADAPCFTIAAVNGDCFGGGVELLSAFDHVICAPHAQFGLWQRKIGLSFGWGGGERLLQRLPRRQLLDKVLTADTFSSYEALKIGLVDEVVSRAKLMETALNRIEKTRELPQTPLEKLRKWNGKNEAALFKSLWMKDEHLAYLRKFKKRSDFA